VAFVNATDSSATSLGATTTLGPISFTDLLSSAFVVGENNSATEKKTNSLSQSQTATQANPTSSNPLSAGPSPISYTDSLLPGSGISNTTLLLVGGVAVLGLVLVLTLKK
jgi:hypothetical protein